MPRRSKFTYGQFDKVLRSLGFDCRTVDIHGRARIYEDNASGARLSLPAYPLSQRVYEYYLVAARIMLEGFGIALPQTFDAMLEKASRARKARAKR